MALCDVDHNRAGDIIQKYLVAKSFTDFLRMLDEMDKRIEGVLVGTPARTHAVAAVWTMKRRKHVYCEKPRTRTVY